MCVGLLTGVGFALTAEPNIFNGTFEEPVLATGVDSDPDAYSWIEAEDLSNTYSRLRFGH